MFKRTLLSLIPIAIIVLLPIMLRKPAEAIDPEADQLIIITPHNEAIRYEFEQAFRKFYHERTGRKVSIDWRAIGGTSEIVRYINSAFTSNFKVYWTDELGREWTDDVEQAFMNRKMKPEQHPARKAFLDSNTGIGIDIFFGGGQYDFNKQAQMGTLVPCGLKKRHPELFTGEQPILTQSLGGEVWYDKDDRYYGACFSSFGLCANLDRLKALGITKPDGKTELTAWTDLADIRLLANVGIADPSKSGSITKCFEMLVQKQMQDTLQSIRQQCDDGSITMQDALDSGWQDAMTLIRKIGGNARYITFSAGKVPLDCATGQIAAGMCIDFYGRSQAEWEEAHVGRPTMAYFTAQAASSVSCDPIGIFRGAPNPERAQLFIDFVMSPRGQAIWNRKVGTPDGPVKYCIHRLPVRKDAYTPESRKYMTAPDADPFALAHSFTYHGEWTGRYFDLLRNLCKVMLIDCQDELRSAWKAIVRAGGPEQCPEAMVEFTALPFRHRDAPEAAKRLQSPETQAVAKREWADFFREHFDRACELARNPVPPSPK